MSFNGSGTYVRDHDWTTDLQNTVPVTASRMDTEHDGFATGLSLTICRDGQSTTTARIPFAAGLSAAAGSASAAAYAQTNDTNTGLYFPAADQWGLSAGGTGTLTSTSTAITVTATLTISGQIFAAAGTVGAPGIAFSDDTDCGLYRIGANNIGIAVNGAKVVDIATTGAAITGTLSSTGATTSGGALTVSAGGAAITGNSSVTGTFGASGNFAINTDKFTVTAASGNTAVGGTLAVTGASTLTGAVAANGGIISPFLHVRDEKADGTDAGTFTQDDWRTRTLNTEKTNTITGASLGSNQITLPAGTYYIHARAPAYQVNEHKAKLRNTTDGSDTLIGSNAKNVSTSALMNDSVVTGRFTIAAQKVFELQHFCNTTKATDGLGNAAGFSVVEVYAEVMIWKLA